MEPQTEIDPQALDRKIRRAGRAAIVFAYLLALFSSVDSSIFWILLGVVSYSVFLWAYYRAQRNPEPMRPGNPWFSPASQRTSSPSRIRIILPVILGLGVFILVVRVILSAGPSGKDGSTDTTNESENETGTSNAENKDLNALTDKGNQWYNQGNYDSALTYYNRVLAVEPDNKYAQYNIALVSYARKDYQRSVPILLKCIHDHPEYAEASWLLGDAYMGLHNQDSAKICLDLAYENGLRDGGFLQELAAQYEHTDKVKAFKLYLESIAADSTLTESYKKLSELDPEHADQYQRLIKKWTK